MIYLGAAYRGRLRPEPRRPVGVWLGDSVVAIGTWALVGAGVVFALLPIWV